MNRRSLLTRAAAFLGLGAGVKALATPPGPLVRPGLARAYVGGGWKLGDRWTVCGWELDHVTGPLTHLGPEKWLEWSESFAPELQKLLREDRGGRYAIFQYRTDGKGGCLFFRRPEWIP